MPTYKVMATIDLKKSFTEIDDIVKEVSDSLNGFTGGNYNIDVKSGKFQFMTMTVDDDLAIAQQQHALTIIRNGVNKFMKETVEKYDIQIVGLEI